jgi:hypothetical protein
MIQKVVPVEVVEVGLEVQVDAMIRTRILKSIVKDLGLTAMIEEGLQIEGITVVTISAADQEETEEIEAIEVIEAIETDKEKEKDPEMGVIATAEAIVITGEINQENQVQKICPKRL